MSAAAQARMSLAAFMATLLAGLTLKPLVQGLGWFAAIAVVVALTSGIGASMRQVTGNVLLVTGAQVAMLAIALTALFARDTALWGVLPGPNALGTMSDLLGQGLEVSRRDAPPVAQTRGLLLLTAGGVGVIGFLVDLVAVTLRRPAAAGLPLLAVYCVPAAVLPAGLPWIYFLLSGAGYLVLVGADSGDRVRSWGRVLAGSGAHPQAALGGPLSGGRRVAATCLVIAVAAPALVPGLGERILGRGSGGGLGSGNGTTISVVNPILNLRADLGSRSNGSVLRYTSDVPSPQPLRIVTDDQFTGSIWQPSTGSLARSQTVQSGLPRPPGLGPDVTTSPHSTQISIGALAQTYLPLPYPTTKVDIAGRWLWDSRTLNVVGEGITTQNVRYTAQFLVVDPTPAQLGAAGRPPADILTRYTALPKSLPGVIAQTAHQVAGQGTQYDQAVRLQTWFRSGGNFTYSEQAPGNGRTDSGQDAVAAFLHDRTGYCVQFASAMAVMARTLGIPARVAVGFLPGTPVDARTYQITLRDAHAWPELYFEGVGWTRFEPTPATRAGSPPAWTLPRSQAGPDPAPSASADTGQPARPAPQARPSLPEPSSNPASTPSGPVRWLEAIPWRLLALPMLLLLLAALPRLASTLTRLLRWRRARTPAARAEAAWEELRLSLKDLGVGWATSWTPRALQLRLVREREFDPAQQAAMARLVADLERARYAPPGSPVRPPEQLQADLQVVVAAVAASVPARTRLRAWLLPASGVASLVGMARQVDAAADQAGQRAVSLGSRVRRSVGAGARRED